MVWHGDVAGILGGVLATEDLYGFGLEVYLLLLLG